MPPDPSAVAVQINEADPRLARISITQGDARSAAVLDVAGMEDLAWRIIDAREHMEPKRHAETFYGTPISLPENGDLRLNQFDDPGLIQVLVMHPGLGWLGQSIDRDGAATMIRILTAFVDRHPGSAVT